MPEGTVQAIGKAKSGKPTVHIDGQVYYSGNTDLNGMGVGDKISFQSNSSVFRGETFWYLNSWKLITAAPVGNAVRPPQSSFAAPAPSQASSGGLTEAERIFAYGVTTESIKAGLIKEPEQIEKWVCAAKNALRSQGE